MPRIQNVFAIIAILAALIAPNAPAGAQQTVQVFDDEFSAGSVSSPASINPSNWQFQTGNGVNGWGNEELEYYTSLPQNTYDDGQYLNIVDLYQPNWDDTGFNWTSGKLLSVPSWTYGQFEMSAELPTGDGVWPAFWLLYTNGVYGDGGWPDNGEIDVMEEVGYDPNEVYFTLHNSQSGVIGTGSGAVSIPTATTGFHTYALDWAPDHISGIYDGAVVYTFQRNGQGWQAWPFDQPFHIILNDAIGGSWGGAEGVNTSISGQDYRIDYIRVSKKESSPYGGAAPVIAANIEAANYDLGGEGYAYHSSTSTNQGGLYRDDGIGIGSSGVTAHPYYVGWMNPDEWVNYTVDVPAAGSYPLTFQLASIYDGESFNVQIDDDTVGTVAVPNTGGWTTWQAVNFGSVNLTAGTHVIRLLSNSPNWNINYFTIGTISSAPAAPTNLTAAAGSGQVVLNWNAATGATSYNIYRGTSSLGEGATPVATGVAAPSFTDTGLSDGVAYYYEVTAVNSAGESAKSNEASATPFAAVSFPAGLQMFSSPYAYPAALSLDTLFGYAGVTLAVWSPTASEYGMTPAAPANEIGLGQGYWVRFPQAVATTVAGTPAPTNQPFTIPLAQGWNMIGDPFLSSVPIASLMFKGGSETFAQATAGTNPLIGATLYGYSQGSNSYYAASSLAPEQGYWILASTATDMEVPAP